MKGGADLRRTAASTVGPTTVCIICGEDLRFRVTAAGDDDVCESPDCRVIMSRRRQIDPHAFRFLVARRRRQLHEAERLAERSAREALENESIWLAVTRQERLSAPQYPLVVLPAETNRSEEPSPDRRQQYREHLAGIIAKAFAGGDDDAPPPQATSMSADPVPLAEQFCALCRGGCCSMGRDHAYLNAATIRRLVRLRPDLSPDQIATEYLDRVSERTVAGSCINHTPTGCGLPREMRSDTCNAFYCRELRDWQARLASGETPRGAVVIQRGHDIWSRERSDAPRDIVAVSIVTKDGARSLDR